MLGAVDMSTAFDMLTFEGFSYDRVPNGFYITSDSRDAMRDELFDGMARNEIAREESLRSAYYSYCY